MLFSLSKRKLWVFIISMVDDKDAEDNANLGNDSAMWRWEKRGGRVMGEDARKWGQ